MIKYIYYEHAVTNSTCTPEFALAQTIITCTRIKISTHDCSWDVWVLYTDVPPTWLYMLLVMCDNPGCNGILLLVLNITVLFCFL